jgi:hypothetical protein
MTLYKYRSDSEYTEKIFTDKRIWLSNAAGLNDPFECTITEIAKDWIEQEIKSLKTAHMEGFIHGALTSMKNSEFFYDLNPKQTKEFLNKFKLKDFDAKYRTVREFIQRKTGKEISNPETTYANLDKQLNEVGIFSLTELDTNELMWAHYADSSKGISIGFERSAGSKLTNDEHCLKVTYSNDRPDFTGQGIKLEVSFYLTGPNTQKISFSDETFRKAVSTKNTIWEYEKEWRYIEIQSGSYPFPGKLKEIIFGVKCPKSVRQKYIDLVKNNFDTSVDFYEIVIATGTSNLIKIKYEH